MSTIYYFLTILIYATIILSIGLYIAHIIFRHHDDVDRIIMARKSILEDLAKIAEDVEENNRILKKIIDYRSAKYR